MSYVERVKFSVSPTSLGCRSCSDCYTIRTAMTTTTKIPRRSYIHVCYSPLAVLVATLPCGTADHHLLVQSPQTGYRVFHRRLLQRTRAFSHLSHPPTHIYVVGTADSYHKIVKYLCCSIYVYHYNSCINCMYTRVGA